MGALIRILGKSAGQSESEAATIIIAIIIVAIIVVFVWYRLRKR